MALAYGDPKASQFQGMLKAKDQEITSLKAKLNSLPAEHVDSTALITANEEKEKVIVKKVKL